jgi:hypothetical protein
VTPPSPDTTPAQFDFTDQRGVPTGSVITSAPVTIDGIDAPAPVTVASGTYSVGCTATYVATPGTVDNGQSVCVRHTSAATADTAAHTTLTVGGVSDVFTSTTAGAPAPRVTLLPYLTGDGVLRLLDPAAARSASNPLTADTGLAPPPPHAVCYDCFGQAETFFAASVSGTAVTGLHASRLAYVKRASGNDAGGAVYALNLTEGASDAPVRISSLADACRIVRSETTDLANIEATAVVIERAGADLSCSESADNVATVIRLDSGAAAAGVDLPLALAAGNPLHALTDANGAVTGYVSFETAGPEAFALVRRDVDLANPVTLQELGQLTGANLARADFTHLFVTATPVEQGLTLFRVETDGSLSRALYSFTGFNAGNPIQDGLRDSVNLYFSDENKLLGIPLDSTTANAVLIATLVHPDAVDADPATNQTLRIGHRALDVSTAPARIVFEAQDDSISTAGGVFSAAVDGTTPAATILANNADGLGGFAVLEVVSDGRAYINVAHHGGEPTHADALKIGTNGAGAVTVPAAYWAGSNRATAYDLARSSAPPTEAIFLGTRAVNEDGTGTDTLYLVDPANGETGIVLGSAHNAAVFLAIRVHGVGRYALARVEKDRFGELDYDTYVVDTSAAGSLSPLAETEGTNDIPLDDLQRLTGNLCLLCL